MKKNHLTKFFKFSKILIFTFLILMPLSLMAQSKGNNEKSELKKDGLTSPVETIRYLSVEGIVNPVMAEFIIDNIDEAEKEGDHLLVIELDTPGGLDLSMREIIKSMMSSEVPVAIYIAPQGSRAASAGAFITYASHIAAMSPGTNIGSAHPVQMGGGEMDETMASKVENDAAMYIKSIAEKRGRNSEWAEKAVRESVNVTSEDALKMNIIDILADDRKDLLAQIDGRKIETIKGMVTMNTKDANIKEVEMNFRFRLLNAITNPNVAYILMMIGMAGLYFELSNPGVIFPGVLGAICLILSFYAFQSLSVNYAGLALIILAVIFFILEIQVVSFGMLSIAGVISLALGSLMLFDSPDPALKLSLSVLIPTLLMAIVFVMIVIKLAVQAHGHKVVSGEEGIIGEIGEASEDFDKEGMVFVAGEYWKAGTKEPIKKGDKIKVIKIKGLHIKVTKI